MAKPLIGITGPESGSIGPRLCISTCIKLAGGRAIQLRPSFSLPTKELDGLVVSGGHDVEPVLYKSAAEVEGNYDPERDRFEVEMINQALAESIPLLGICRGAQLLNVCLGGNLIQDLQRLHQDTKRRRTILPVKPVSLVARSKLAMIVGSETLKVNSLHNQSIDRVGVGLEISARDQRDIVQAIESTDDSFVLGVQWHPEFLLYKAATWRIFRALVGAAARINR